MGDKDALCRCVDGISLDDCMDLLPVGDSPVYLKKREKMVVEIAAQLMQVTTLCL